jgi:glutamate formiminotransferase / formiminotetrahydrofolate cyclodeaminase
MPKPLVECIPNFSDARRPEVIEAIVQAIQSVPGVRVLDRHSDLDHNRTVITFVGEPSPVEEAAFQGIAKAAQLIDLNHHTGEHPRIGATDVVPFVPLNQVKMDECIKMARRLGERVGKELRIPVYLYEEAATRPDRQNLENIRHGQYEGLKSEISKNPDRFPDFGPAELGSAGATVIGARNALIAYNVYLTTGDITIAQKIAKAIRHSSGGLHYVKSIGVLVEGKAQVSINLTNYRHTPIARVVETIRREAAHYGVAILRSELVGMIPQDALVNAAKWYLQLDDLETGQILEQKLADLLSSETETITPKYDFLDELAKGQAAPGGGAAAAYAGASAAALVAMIARLTIGKKNYIDVENQMIVIRNQAEVLRSELTTAIVQDSSAYNAYLAALHLPKDTPEQTAVRSATTQEALLQAAQVPLEICKKVNALFDLIIQIAQTGNINALSDACSAAYLAEACFKSACLNVQTNINGLENKEAGQTLLQILFGLKTEFDSQEIKFKAIWGERGSIKFS